MPNQAFIGRQMKIASTLATPIVTFGTITDTTVVVNWTFVTNGVSYKLQRSTTIDFSGLIVDLVVTGSNTFTDNGPLAPGTIYYYRVIPKAVNFIDGVPGINSVTTTGGTGLAAPVITRLGYGLNSMSTTWGFVPNATGYELHRATNTSFTANLVTRYNGNIAGVTREFQPGFTLDFHDTGLTAATTYSYRVRSTGPGGPSAWSPTLTVTTGTSNKTATPTGPTQVINGSDQEFQWFNGSVTVNVHGGDTVAVSPPTGGQDWQYMVWQRYNATPTEPLTVRNQGDIKMTAGMSFFNCSYINMDFSHSSKTQPKGLYVESLGGAAFEFNGLSHHIKCFNVKSRGAAYAWRLKNEANSFTTTNPDCGIQFMWPSHLHDFEIAFWDSAEHSQDGAYCGSSDPWGVGRPFTCNGVTVFYRPTGLANINVHHNSMGYTGRSGYQIGSMDLGTNSFHDNTIFQTGFEYAVDQGAGMAVGGATRNIEIYNNTITGTFREPMYSYGFGQVYYHNNTHDQAGVIDVDPLRVFFWTKINLTAGQTLSSQWMDTAPGKTIMDNLGEYYFEFFLNESGNPKIKTQRVADATSTTQVVIPTTHPTAVSLTVQTGRTYNIGQVVKVINYIDKTKWFTMTVSSYNSTTGVLAGNSNSNTGTGTFKVWAVYKETRTAEQAIAAISTTAPGTHAGTQADPFAGFGASSPILSSQVSYPATISIPGGQAVGNIMMNCFDDHSIENYGDPAGRTTFRIENNTFGSQQAPNTKVLLFLNSKNWYGTGNIICGNTYLGSSVIEANITKPSGGIVTYTLNSTCVPTGSLVEQQDTFNIQFGTTPGLTWLPSDYNDPANSSLTYSLIIFLHGAGEGSPTRNDALLKSQGLPKIISDGNWNGIAQNPVTGLYHKSIVCAPQGPGGSHSGADLSAILTDIIATYRVDQTRIYITGLSTGGSGCISIGVDNNLRTKTALIAVLAAAGFNSTAQDNAFDAIGGTYGVGMLDIVGALDGGWNSFNTTLVNRYNAFSPAPAVAAKLRVVAGASHDNTVFQGSYLTTFDVNNGVGTPENIYNYMLRFHR